MNVVMALVLVCAIAGLGWAGGQVAALNAVFGIALPYLAFAVFVGGVVYRVVRWGRSPVPFRIPTPCGQEQSLPWIQQAKIDNPSTTLGVVSRMALEVLFFRSLIRNTRVEIKEGPKVTYASNLWLWAAGLAFHYSFLVILLRHFRLFTEPTPAFFSILQSVDGFLQIGVPVLFMTDVVLLAAVTFLFARRVASPQLAYISQVADYFPLFLILGIAATGVIMRHFLKVDIMGVKQLTIGLVTFRPAVPAGVGPIFYAHVALVCALFVYFPWSKLVHMAGVFLSPTRTLANNNRMKRHLNPWHPKVEPHTYAEWEEEFKDKIEAAGIPLDKD